MRVDIQGLLSEPNGVQRFDFGFPVDVLDGVDGASAEAVGAVANHGGYVELTAVLTVRGVGRCARCLDEVPFEKCFDVKRPVVKALREADDDGEYIVADGDGYLSLRPVFEEELILNFPSRLLCKEGCRGLCPKCGANLNEGDCGCSTAEVDPRLEVLRALLDNS